MKKLRFLVSLITERNDYQHEQALAANTAAQRLGVDADVVYAGNDAINQSQQLLSVIQSSSAPLPDGILCHPSGTGLEQVAKAALARGIGWALLNRDADYVTKLNGSSRVPIFEVSVDQKEVGEIQGRQISALLPQGGVILYIQGPAVSPSSQLRSEGVYSTKPDSVQVRTLRGRWTEESGYEAVQSWLRLSTSQQAPISMVACQNDDMALGARRALDQNRGLDRNRWSSLPFTGCDGCPGKGQEWVRKGLLTASIVVPPTAGLALELFVRHLQAHSQPPERTLLKPTSFPAIEELSNRATAASI